MPPEQELCEKEREQTVPGMLVKTNMQNSVLLQLQKKSKEQNKQTEKKLYITLLI